MHVHRSGWNSIALDCLPPAQTYPSPHLTSATRVVSVHSEVSPVESQALKYPARTVLALVDPSGQYFAMLPHSFCTRLLLPLLQKKPPLHCPEQASVCRPWALPYDPAGHSIFLPPAQ